MKQRGPSMLLLPLVAVIFGVFFLWPLVESMRGAFVDQAGHFTLAYVTAVFQNPVYLIGFRNSFSVAVGATLLCAVVGIPLSLLFARYEFPGRRWLAVLVPLPLFVPPFVGALGPALAGAERRVQCGAGGRRTVGSGNPGRLVA